MMSAPVPVNVPLPVVVPVSVIIVVTACTMMIVVTAESVPEPGPVIVSAAVSVLMRRTAETQPQSRRKIMPASRIMIVMRGPRLPGAVVIIVAASAPVTVAAIPIVPRAVVAMMPAARVVPVIVVQVDIDGGIVPTPVADTARVERAIRRSARGRIKDLDGRLSAARSGDASENSAALRIPRPIHFGMRGALALGIDRPRSARAQPQRAARLAKRGGFGRGTDGRGLKNDCARVARSIDESPALEDGDRRASPSLRPEIPLSGEAGIDGPPSRLPEGPVATGSVAARPPGPVLPVRGLGRRAADNVYGPRAAWPCRASRRSRCYTRGS